MTARILVVDDEPDLEVLVEQRFRKAIGSGEMSFRYARDGEAALAVLRDTPDIDMVLTDINMPGMDGLTLLSRLPGVNPSLKAVVVSAYGDMANIRTAMNRGAFDFVTKPIEFADLRTTIDKTLAALHELREAHRRREAAERARLNLSRYFAPSVVEILASTDEPFGTARQHQAAVLFADIVGFTQLCADEQPEEVFRLLRRFFGRMARQVFGASGTVDKYIGDGLMASFGVPLAGTHDATNALRCALAMQRRLARWNAEQQASGLPTLRVAIGVHYGPVLVGNVGDEQRLEFATIGDTVNVASRLENIARPLKSSIVLSQALVDQVRLENEDGLPELALFQQIESQPLRGHPQGMTVWTLPDSGPVG